MQTASGARRLPLVLLAIAVAIGVVGGVGLLLARDDRGPSPTTSPSTALAPRAAAIREGCEQWLADGQHPAGRDSDPRWCGAWSRWMLEQMRGPGMGPGMMWRNAEDLRTSCRQWMVSRSQGTGPDADGRAWCDAMTDWMRDHLRSWSGRDDWDAWMEHGPMSP